MENITGRAGMLHFHTVMRKKVSFINNIPHEAAELVLTLNPNP